MRPRFARLLSPCVVPLVCLLAAADWPGFRGPQGTGISPEHGLPVKWGPEENLAWKTKLPGPGASSPIAWGDRVFVTCFTGYGGADRKSGDQSQLRRHLVCLERTSGKILWQADVPAKLPETDWTSQVSQHGYATSTPTTDGERVYVFFGQTGVFAFDFNGKQLWQADVGHYRNTFGTGSSPTLCGSRLIVNATVESGRLVALDRASGKVLWRVKMADDCWSTPLVVSVPGGSQELVFNAPSALLGLDPEDGKELWRCEFPEPRNVSVTPVVKDGIIYCMGTGNLGRVFLAVRAGGRGDVTKTHLLWRQKIGATNCSPILVGDYLYFFSMRACCLRADTGAIVFQEPLAGLGPEYPSPVAADGRIYLVTRRGNGYVLAAKDRLEVLANNDLGDTSGFVASPAISRGHLFIRSNEYLYCIGTKD
jgi:outer membrane protein assembly factor BamB